LWDPHINYKLFIMQKEIIRTTHKNYLQGTVPRPLYVPRFINIALYIRN